MNGETSFELVDVVLTIGVMVVWTVVAVWGASWAARRLHLGVAESELHGLGRALGLEVVRGGLSGARRGVLVRLERHAASGGDDGAWQVELMDPRGPAGLDLVRAGLVPLGSGLPVGDRSFDDVVHVTGNDHGLALACLPPSSREVVREGVRQGWERHGATWRLQGVGALAELLDVAVEQGMRLCSVLRSDGVGVRHRLRMRSLDPVPGVAAHALRLRLDRDWIDAEELRGLLHHRACDVAVRSAAILGDVAWLEENAQRAPGLERRLRAALALVELGVGERLPVAVEALLLRGLDGPLHDRCVAVLAEVGEERSLEELAGWRGAEWAVARIQTRRSRRIGGVALADGDGGQVALVHGGEG